jgi:hypothetical protein
LLTTANNFRFVKIDNCNMTRNSRFGLSVKKFYGLMHLMDSRMVENDGHGIFLSTDRNKDSRADQRLNAANSSDDQGGSMSSE